uniref:Homeobox domain-containing protein n=1 Tax=Steinernema glaseri TaxID=37863 RepID=A0A1I8ARV2_9BILA
MVLFALAAPFDSIALRPAAPSSSGVRVMSREDRSAFSISHLLQSNSPSSSSTAVEQIKSPLQRRRSSGSASTPSPTHSSAVPLAGFDSDAFLVPLPISAESDIAARLADTTESSSSRTSPESEPMELSQPGPFSSPQWYNAVNYVNMATQQISQQLASSAAAQQSLIPTGWDPRLPWIYPYMHKTQQKRKGGQIRFTNEQTDALEQKFDNHKYLSPQERKKLAKSLQLSERQFCGLHQAKVLPQWKMNPLEFVFSTYSGCLRKAIRFVLPKVQIKPPETPYDKLRVFISHASMSFSRKAALE